MSYYEDIERLTRNKDVKSLIKLLCHDYRFKQIVPILEDLKNTGEPVISYLTQAIIGETDVNIRINSLMALGLIGDRTSYDTFLNIIKYDKNRNVIVSAITSLVKLKNLTEEKLLKPLFYILINPDMEPYVKKKTARILRSLKNKKSVEPLIRLLSTEKNYDVLYSIIQALGEIGDERAVPALAQLVNSGRKYVRIFSIESLGNIGDKTAAPALLYSLRSPDIDVMNFSAEALAKISIINEDSLIDLNLLELLKQKNPYLPHLPTSIITLIIHALLKHVDKNNSSAIRLICDLIPHISYARKDILENLKKSLSELSENLAAKGETLDPVDFDNFQSGIVCLKKYSRSKDLNVIDKIQFITKDIELIREQYEVDMKDIEIITDEI